MGWHWGEAGRHKREKEAEGDRETEHMRHAHTRMEGGTRQEIKDRDKPGCVTKQAEVARAEAWPIQRKSLICRQRK